MHRREFAFGLITSGFLPRLLSAADSNRVGTPLDAWTTLPDSRGLEPAFEYLSRLDPAKITPGRAPVLGDEVFAMISRYTTKAPEDLRFEAHRKYIDVQYLVSGEETIGFVPEIAGLSVVEPYDADKDIEFYAAPARYSRWTLKAGRFVILRPGQAHMPGCHLGGSHDVVKVVVKVSDAWRAARRRAEHDAKRPAQE
jgi:biofilm protein TabA